MPDQEQASGFHPFQPFFVVPHQYREAATFSGASGDDAQDWLKKYGRVARYNHWNDETKLVNAPFYLSSTALTWFENNEAQLSTWDNFTADLLAVFGSGDDRKKSARASLAMRAQRLNETCAAYIQDVLHLCTVAEPSMNEQDKIGHLLKGIADDVFNFLVQKNMSTVKEFVKECNRFEELKKSRVTPQFCRLTNVPSVAVLQDCEGLPSNIQQLIRQEVQKVLATMNIRPSYSSPTLEDIIRNEVSSCLAPSTTFPTSRTTAMELPFQSRPEPSFQMPTNMTAPHPIEGRDFQPYRQSFPARQWQSRPVCYSCGRPGHTFRNCRSSFQTAPRNVFSGVPAVPEPERDRALPSDTSTRNRSPRDQRPPTERYSSSSPQRLRSPSPSPSTRDYPYRSRPASPYPRIPQEN